MNNSDNQNANSDNQVDKLNGQEPSFNIPSVFMNSRSGQYGAKKNLDEILPEKDYKKIVVYIYGQENIEYVNSLSAQERNKVINGILDICKTKSFLQIKRDYIKNYIIQFLIIILTTTLSIPLVLMVIQKSYQLTKESYQFSEDNFRKLYKDKHIPIPNEKKINGYNYK